MSLFLHSHAPLLTSFYHSSQMLHSSTTSSLTITSSTQPHIARRSASYQPNLWNYDFLGSLSTNHFKVEKYGEERDKIIAVVKNMMNDSSMDAITRLEFVDAIDRLGLKRHFQQQIINCVHDVYYNHVINKFDEDIYATALRFRILRQYGYAISEEIFNKFKDEEGNIAKVHSKDIKGLLSLYEASFLESRADNGLDEIRVFAARHLKEQLKYEKLEQKWAKVVEQALDLPLHWRFPRLKARWSIQAYHLLLHPSLVALATLDYNIVQTCYKEEIKQLVRWWKEMDLPRKLGYSRDRLMEHYLWTVGIVEDPQHHNYRLFETKIVCLITALDDTYDVYGTIDELEILTHLIHQWDINGIEQLPEPMRHCFQAIYNTSNEIADWTIKEKGFDIIPYLSKAWARLSKSYLKEAKWYHEGHKPCLSEYIENGIVSIGAHLMLLDSYYLTTPSISTEALDYINNLPNILRYGATVIRLSNDLATSKDELARGDTLKALQCYMNESGASEDVAREHMTSLIKESWKKMNEEYYLLRPQYPDSISEPFLGANLNLARTSQFFYSFKKDWHGKPDKKMMNHICLLLINHIPMSTLNVS